MKYVGILFDELTTNVGAKIVQDIIAMLAITSMYRLQLVICCPDKKVESILSSFGIEVVSDLSLPKLFIVYKEGEAYPEVPDNCITKVLRNFEQKEKRSNILLDHGSMGHPLEDYGNRISYSNLNRIWNHPNGYAPPDAAMVMMWGPVKG